jgi:hypothetical protein
MKKKIFLLLLLILFLANYSYCNDKYRIDIGAGYVADDDLSFDCYTKFSQIFNNSDFLLGRCTSSFESGELFLKINYGYKPNALMGLNMMFKDGYFVKTLFSGKEGRGRFYIEKSLEFEFE